MVDQRFGVLMLQLEQIRNEILSINKLLLNIHQFLCKVFLLHIVHEGYLLVLGPLVDILLGFGIILIYNVRDGLAIGDLLLQFGESLGVLAV